MAKITAKYLGDLRVECRDQATGSTIFTDAPKDKQGRAEYITPTALCTAALCGCAMTNMGVYAKTRNLDITGATIELSRTMTEQAPQRIARLELVFTVPDRGLSDKDKTGLERAAATCHVHNSLHPDIEQKFTFVWVK